MQIICQGLFFHKNKKKSQYLLSSAVMIVIEMFNLALMRENLSLGFPKKARLKPVSSATETT